MITKNRKKEVRFHESLMYITNIEGVRIVCKASTLHHQVIYADTEILMTYKPTKIKHAYK